MRTAGRNCPVVIRMEKVYKEERTFGEMVVFSKNPSSGFQEK